MGSVILLAPFVVLGLAVLYLAFSGGGGGRSDRRRSRPSAPAGIGAGFKAGISVLLLVLGLAVPVAIVAAREQAVGGVGQLTSEKPDAELAEGKILFGQNCASCHSLAAVNARGATGPNLDDLGQLSQERVLNAIRNGGTGDLRMPAGLLEGGEAEAVADYVSKTAGQ